MPLVANARIDSQTIRTAVGGLMDRDLDRRASNVQAAARAQAGHRSGDLARRIVKNRVWAGLNPAVDIVSQVPYSAVHHFGSRPHVILPRKPGGVLRFPSRGGVVYARRVNHPGTKANPFLLANLHLAAL